VVERGILVKVREFFVLKQFSQKPKPGRKKKDMAGHGMIRD